MPNEKAELIRIVKNAYHVTHAITATTNAYHVCYTNNHSFKCRVPRLIRARFEGDENTHRNTTGVQNLNKFIINAKANNESILQTVWLNFDTEPRGKVSNFAIVEGFIYIIILSAGSYLSY